MGEDVLQVNGDAQTDVSHIWDPVVMPVSNPPSLLRICSTPFPSTRLPALRNHSFLLLILLLRFLRGPFACACPFDDARSVILAYQYTVLSRNALHAISLLLWSTYLWQRATIKG